MINKTVTLTTSFDICFDPESDEVKETLASYRGSIFSDGTIDDILKDISHNIVHGKHGGLMEGIGYIKWRGAVPDEPYSGFELVSLYRHEPEIT